MADQSTTTLAGPEFGIVHTMRPYVGFEAKYQGQPVTHSIVLCEANKPYDPLAARGVPGVDPHLVAGLPCVMGCRVMIWMPRMFGGGTGVPYQLEIAWRFRNLFDHRNSADRIPWHIAKQGAGVPDGGLVDPGPRTLCPACWESMIYTQTEPPVPDTNSAGVVNVRKQLVVACLTGIPNADAPIMPDGIRGAVQQGADHWFLLFPDAYLNPGWLFYETQAAGDELVLMYTRPVGAPPSPNWNFNSSDRRFAQTLGADPGNGVSYPDIGVYVAFGVSP